MLITLVGFVAMLTSTLCLVPQIVHTVKTKSVDDLSGWMLLNYVHLLCELGDFMDLLISAVSVWLTNVIGAVCSAFLLYLKMAFTRVLNSHKCIIYLNGTFPTLGGLGSLNTDVPIIACDGAVHKMHAWPTYVLGDLDSIDGTKPQCTVIERADQNYTDFEKALMFARDEKLTPALVLGVNGGEIDHIIGNMQVISKYADTIPSHFLDFYDGGVKLGMPLIAHRRISTIPGSLISIIPFEKTHLTTKGLKWELKRSRASLQWHFRPAQ